MSQYFPAHQQIPTGVQLPTFGSSPTIANTAASTGAAASAAGTNMWGAIISQALPAVASLLGAKSSGQARLNKAQASILEQLLAEYKKKAPVRQGLDASFLGRLPDYMRGNFPQGLTTPPSPLAQALKTGTPGEAPRFPQY